MDRGRPPDDGTEDVGLGAEDNDTTEVRPTADGGARPDADAPGNGPPDARSPTDDERPAVWLADIRARAPWLLLPDADPLWSGMEADGPDRIPHGQTPPSTWSATDGLRRAEQPASTPVSEVGRGEASDGRADPAGAGETGEGSATVGGRPSTFDRDPAPAGAPTPSPLAGLPDPEASDPASPASMGWPPADAGDPGPPGTVGPWSFQPERPRAAGPDQRLAETVPPTGTQDSPVSPWPEPGPRRPPIRRSSATWSAPPLHPAPPPVWPPRPNPEGSVLPHQPSAGIPDRLSARPATPFIAGRTEPLQDTGPASRPTWEEDRTGWRSSAPAGVPVFDAAAFPTWPSLLDDDGGDDVLDWSPLDRRLERIVRLDREQRRR